MSRSDEVALETDGVESDEATLQTDDHSEGLKWALRISQVARFPGSSNGSQHPSALVGLNFLAPTNGTFGIRVDLRHECLEPLVVKAMVHTGDALSFTRRSLPRVFGEGARDRVRADNSVLPE